MADLRIVFYVGRESSNRSLSQDYKADEMLAGVFGGSTRIETRGSWRGPNGLEFEPSIRFEVLTNHNGADDKARKMAEELRKLYRQKEVLYSIDAVFIGRAIDHTSGKNPIEEIGTEVLNG